MKKKKIEKEFWLYHPGLNIPEKGFTGYYRPAGVHPATGELQVELIQVISLKNVSLFPELERLKSDLVIKDRMWGVI